MASELLTLIRREGTSESQWSILIGYIYEQLGHCTGKVALMCNNTGTTCIEVDVRTTAATSTEEATRCRYYYCRCNRTCPVIL